MLRRQQQRPEDGPRVEAMLWVYFVVSVLVGALLYWLRCRHRILYGMGEILVALLLLYLLFFPETPTEVGRNGWTGSLGPVWGGDLSRAVTWFVALYALVRGLDNVDALSKWNRLIRQRGHVASSDPKPREPSAKVYAAPRATAAKRRRPDLGLTQIFRMKRRLVSYQTAEQGVKSGTAD
jgi:hypothetical protein